MILCVVSSLTAVLLTPRAKYNLLYIRISTSAKASQKFRRFDFFFPFEFLKKKKRKQREIFLLDNICASSMSTNNAFHNDFLGFDNTIQYQAHCFKKKIFVCVVFKNVCHFVGQSNNLNKKKAELLATIDFLTVGQKKMGVKMNGHACSRGGEQSSELKIHNLLALLHSGIESCDQLVAIINIPDATSWSRPGSPKQC